MNGLSVMNRTAPVSRYIRAVNSAMVFLSRKFAACVMRRPVSCFVMPGLVPGIPLRRAQSLTKRDGRDKPGHDSVGIAHAGAFGPAFLYQSAIWAPVQNSTSFFFLIFSKILRKYLARCGAPMM